MSLYDAAVVELSTWAPPDAEQEALRTTYLAHLHDHADGLLRTCAPDHLTASLLVVNATRDRVLLNLHRRYRIWVQFGGHCEDEDANLAAAALREGTEESGLATLTLADSAPAQLSTHEVRCGPIRPSHHLDVRYVAVAADGAEAVASSESLEVRWFDCAGLPDGVDEPLRRLIRRAQRM